MDTKKIIDTLALLEHQLDSANERVKDPFYAHIDFNRKRNRYIGKDGFDYFEGVAVPKNEPSGIQIQNNNVFKQSTAFSDFELTKTETNPPF